MFQVELKKSVKKDLDGCPPGYKERIIEAAKFLREEPYPFKFYDVRKVKGLERVYGIRIGRYRLLYEVFREERLILVFKLELKSETTYRF